MSTLNQRTPPCLLSGLSSLARDGFYTMALSSGRKKSTQSDSDSDSDDEVHDELPIVSGE
jgi:hypothetical protein